MCKDKNTMIKKTLFVLLLLFLFIPLIQQKLHIIYEAPLNGSFSVQEAPYFTYETWLEGNFQDQQQKYVNENFGFRNFCVRLNNQIAYSFFNYAKANGVIIGKDNYLYEENYIKAFLGTDFIGKDSIIDKVQELKKIQDTLKSKNIDLVVVFAPGKGTFFPEYIPDNYSNEKKSITNYTYYLEEFNKNDIHFLDFNKWFLQMKDTAPYPLYPKCGIHWSKYGELLAADSIIKYIQTIRNINIAEIQFKNIEIPDTTRDTDDDIERGMNLLFDIPDLKMAYPSFKIVTDSNSIKPKVLTIADSYYWGMFNWGLSNKVFNNGQFWFYNQQIYPDSYTKPIKETPEWIQSITEQATKDNLPIEEAIRKNAEYMVWEEENKKQ